MLDPLNKIMNSINKGNRGRGKSSNGRNSRLNKEGNKKEEWITKPYRVTIRKDFCVPDELRVTLRYTQRVPLASVAGVPGSYLFVGNGPFDPDSTGTGLQPEGYDEWSTLYTKQKTLSSRCMIKGINTVQTLAFEELVLAPVPQTVSVITDINNLKSSKYARTVLVATNTRPSVIDEICSTAKIVGIAENAVETEINYSSLTTALPGVVWYWQIAMQPVDQTSSVTLVVYVEVDYDIIFYSRRALALS